MRITKSIHHCPSEKIKFIRTSTESNRSLNISLNSSCFVALKDILGTKEEDNMVKVANVSAHLC